MIRLKKRKNQEIKHWDESLEISYSGRDLKDTKIVQRQQDWLSGTLSISIFHFQERTQSQCRDKSTVEKQVSIQTMMNETVTYQQQHQQQQQQ